jgi:hypothetical protein
MADQIMEIGFSFRSIRILEHAGVDLGQGRGVEDRPEEDRLSPFLLKKRKDLGEDQLRTGRSIQGH